MKADQPVIPRILHHIYLGGALPDEFKANVAHIQSENPDWEHRFYDDARAISFIEKNYERDVLGAFLQINPKYGAARADLLRYLVIYKTGGLYLDVKSFPRARLSQVVAPTDEYLLAKWRNRKGEKFDGAGLHWELRSCGYGEFQQWHVCARPGHPFLKAVIERVLQNISRYNPIIHGVGAKGVLKLTGPIAYTLAIAPILQDYPHRITDSDGELGFEYSIFRSNRGNIHKRIGRPHYSELLEPIVGLDRWPPSGLFLVRTVNRARHRISRLFPSKPGTE